MPPRKKEPLLPSDVTETTPDEAQTANAQEEIAVQTVEKPLAPRRRRTSTDASATATNAAAAEDAATIEKPVRPRKRSTPRKAAGNNVVADSAVVSGLPVSSPQVEPAESFVQEAAGSGQHEGTDLPHLLETSLKKKDRKETHEKERVYLRKDLKERLERVSTGRGKGFKTLLLNYGLEKALDELEQAEASLEKPSDRSEP